jgi:RNA polymerase sigma-70 factor (ECF subfamily)
MERDLVQRAQGGDREAFTQLAAALTDRLYSVAYRMLRDTSLAEDATQQALLDAWRKLPQLRDTDRVEAWMHRLLINACKDELRRARGREAKLQLLCAPERSSPDAALAVEQRDQLDRAFARLSPEHRAVVVLRHYLFWSPDEIGRSLGLPTGTVASRLHNGMNALRAALEADARQPGADAAAGGHQ